MSYIFIFVFLCSILPITQQLLCTTESERLNRQPGFRLEESQSRGVLSTQFAGLFNSYLSLLLGEFETASL